MKARSRRRRSPGVCAPCRAARSSSPVPPSCWRWPAGVVDRVARDLCLDRRCVSQGRLHPHRAQDPRPRRRDPGARQPACPRRPAARPHRPGGIPAGRDLGRGPTSPPRPPSWRSWARRKRSPPPMPTPRRPRSAPPMRSASAPPPTIIVTRPWLPPATSPASRPIPLAPPRSPPTPMPTRARAAYIAANQQLAVVQQTRGQLVAALNKAKAALSLARQDLGHTLIRSPVDRHGRRPPGADRGIRPARHATAYHRAAEHDLRRRQFQGDADHADAGRPARRNLHRRAERRNAHRNGRELRARSGSEFSLLPFEPATGNFTRIVQRVPVRIHFDPNQPSVARLRPGLSADVTVRLKE